MHVKTLSVLLGIVSPIVTDFALAGSLEPPGPPSPTMKTLAEAEPRIPIHAADLPLTISAPGSYYFSESIEAVSSAITIAASGVTIDLSGFALSGPIGSSGIVATAGVARIRIRNGHLIGWSNALALSAVPGVALNNLTVKNSGGAALLVGDRARVQDVIVEGPNPGMICGSDSMVFDTQISVHGTALTVGPGSLISNTIARGNDGLGVSGSGMGPVVIARSTISGEDDGLTAGAVAVQITDSVIEAGGDQAIQGGNGSRIAHTRVTGGVTYAVVLGTGSYVEGSLIGPAGGTGLTVGDGSTVLNTSISVSAVGLKVGSRSTIIGNSCTGSDPAGIQVSGSGNRIDGNTVTSQSIGFKIDGTANTVIRNIAVGNTTANYQIAGGNYVGPIGAAGTASSPWANIGD